MDLFDILSLVGGLSLFLFGMSIMGTALEQRAGGKLKQLLGKLTGSKAAGFFTGLAVTAVIQSSSATTVMVVGFVNSGIMTLKQAINVIVGANVGTTVTAWILSLSGISGDSLLITLLKPTSFTPVLALVGIIFYMMSKESTRKDTGLILLGFATLMFGMDTMSSAVSGLRNVPEFADLMLKFQNPLLGVLAGALLTAVIQSSSASVGILQALAISGSVSYGAAIPIIMGQNIGTTVTALISSVGANKNGRRAAIVHLFFNIIGAGVWLAVFCVYRAVFAPAFIDGSVDAFGIAVIHTIFNLLCTALILPFSSLLEKLAYKIIKDDNEKQVSTELDERLMASPAIAIEQCRKMTSTMAAATAEAIEYAFACLTDYKQTSADIVRKDESAADHYEDILGTYLVKLGTHHMGSRDSSESVKLLHMIGDFERISDHAVNLVESAEECQTKGIIFTDEAKRELSVILSAVSEILGLSVNAFNNDDTSLASKVEPLEQVVDVLKEQLRTRHIHRMQSGRCSIEAGFVWSDILTDLERISDHCSNIAVCILEMSHDNLDVHEYLEDVHSGSNEFKRRFEEYSKKYALV